MANVLNMQGGEFESSDELKASRISVVACHRSKQSWFACFVK